MNARPSRADVLAAAVIALSVCASPGHSAGDEADLRPSFFHSVEIRSEKGGVDRRKVTLN